ncbi:hypothetical protein V7S43_016495 [Phytophthora oleae]|uniref:Uncharacterized protein n=1 Tax=Phytophthora oleae TaxID=2107226 RepID=A0ABD3EWC4_9STRA
MMAAIKCVCCVLLYVAVAAARDEQLRVDELFVAKVQEMQRESVGVEHQLSVAKQMTELFNLEDAQLQMFSRETRYKLTSIQAEVKREMDNAVLEVENVRRTALENVTAWIKSLQELQEATERNKQTLQSIREQKELEEQQRKAMKELELQEREKQREKALELEREAEEMKNMQERERQKKLKEQRALETKKKKLEEQRALETKNKELEEQRALGQLQALEKEKKELEERQKQHEIELQALEKENERQKELQQKRDLEEQKEREAEEKESNDQAAKTLPSDSTERASTVKTVLIWYVSMEQTLLDAGAAVYRQLVLPVVAILAFFLLLTVAIAKYNAMKQAQRNRRVLYSGYPASYQRKVKQQEKPATTDGPGLRPRLRHSLPHRDPNGVVGN